VWHWDRSPSELFCFLLSVLFHLHSPYSYYKGINNRLIGVRSSETLSHLIDINNNNISAPTSAATKIEVHRMFKKDVDFKKKRF
jgi:hypothetical protein